LLQLCHDLSYISIIRDYRTLETRRTIMTAPQELEITFQDFIKGSPEPVLVDFWAPWCGPCRLLTPIIDGLAEEYADRLRVLKVNVDEQPAIASQYGITSIPTVILFHHGRILERMAGVVPASTWRSKLDQHLEP
jgi:thioredoxin 1